MIRAAEPGKSLEHRRAYGFVEADYHARFFGGLVYGSGAPADLPSRIYLGGATVSAGIEVMLDASRAKIAPESQRSKTGAQP